jgi:hypothetical protein
MFLIQIKINLIFKSIEYGEVIWPAWKSAIRIYIGFAGLKMASGNKKHLRLTAIKMLSKGNNKKKKNCCG